MSNREEPFDDDDDACAEVPADEDLIVVVSNFGHVFASRRACLLFLDTGEKNSHLAIKRDIKGAQCKKLSKDINFFCSLGRSL